MKLTQFEILEYQQLKDELAKEYRQQTEESQRHYCYKPHRTIHNY